MKQGQKFILFSSVVLGSVVAGSVTVQADTVRPQARESQIIEKSDKASAEDQALAKELFAAHQTESKPARRQTPAINTMVIEKSDQVTEDQAALADQIFGQANTAETDKKEAEPATPSQPAENPEADKKKEETVADSDQAPKKEESGHVSISLEKSVATIQYDRPEGEADTTVLHAIWSEKDGQDDVEWLHANAKPSQVDLEKHGGYGLYHINSYKEVAGNLMLFNKASLDYKASVLEKKTEPAKPQVDLSLQVEGDKLQVELKASKDLGQALVQYAVWSEENGRDDIQWYIAKQTTTIDLTKHKGYGTYHLAAYAWLDNAPVSLTSANFRYEKKAERKAVVTPHIEGDTLVIDLERSEDLKGKTIKHAVWSVKNDQDDIVWYPAGESQTKIDLGKHKDAGTYLIHTYLFENGQAIGLDGTSIDYQPTPKAEKKASLPSTGTYTFTERASIKNQATLASPEIAYFDKGMSVYYDKLLENEGHQWLGYVSYTGKRLYVDLGAVASASTPKVEKKAERKAVVTPRIEGDTLVIDLKRSEDLKGKDIKHAVWSVKNNQDDIVWYPAGENQTKVDLSKHKDAGTYLIHTYLFENGQAIGLDGTSIDYQPAPKVEKKTSLPSSGTYTFAERAGIKAEPKTAAQDLAFYDKGMTVNYDKTLTADGQEWISYLSYSGNRRYIAVGKANQASPAPAPVAKPAPAVKDEATNLVAARLAFAQHGLTSTFDVEVTDLTGKGSLHYAVWNGQNDQDDLKWYDMKRVGDKFIGSFDINNHRGNGPLYIHAYYQEAPGAKMQFVRGLQF